MRKKSYQAAGWSWFPTVSSGTSSWGDSGPRSIPHWISLLMLNTRAVLSLGQHAVCDVVSLLTQRPPGVSNAHPFMRSFPAHTSMGFMVSNIYSWLTQKHNQFQGTLGKLKDDFHLDLVTCFIEHPTPNLYARPLALMLWFEYARPYSCPGV